VIPAKNQKQSPLNQNLRSGLKNLDSAFSTATRNSGGAKEDRTPDLLRAKQALSQLSYGPSSLKRAAALACLSFGGSGQTRTADLTLIRGAL
jgi:hypothetical protein